MEKTGFARQAVLRLPPGFRFRPTDEELVLQYLRRKAFSCPLPAAVIPEIDLLKYNPWDLPAGGAGEESYFFNLRQAKYTIGRRSNRATGLGYWKATGKEKQVIASVSNQVVGIKKVLVFYQGRPPRGTRTDWVMHEYRLSGPEAAAGGFSHRRNPSVHNSVVSIDDWVLCRIFKKERAARMEAEFEETQVGNGTVRLIDFMGSSSSSGSSCVTELCDESSNGEETTSRGSSPAP